MARREFTSKTRKQALKRSGGICEAQGSWYGLDGRCSNSLAYGVEYDHIILDANSKDNSLENCAAVCIRCHDHKTRHHDTPLAAKTVAQSLMGKKTRVKTKIASRPKAPKPARDMLPTPERRSLFRPAEPIR